MEHSKRSFIEDSVTQVQNTTDMIDEELSNTEKIQLSDHLKMGANLRVSNGSRKRNSSKRKGQHTGPNIQFESLSAIARIFGQNVSMNESKSEAMHDSFQVFSE